MSFDPKKVYAMTERDNRQFADWVPLRMFDIPGALGIINLGKPEVVNYDNILAAGTVMKNGSYFSGILSQPDVCRQLVLTRAVVGGADTPGGVLIKGTDFYGNYLSAVLIPGANAVHVSTDVFFKTITDIIGDGWSRDAGAGSEDTISLGWGQNLGVPYLALTSADQIKMCYVAAVAMLGTKYFTGADPLKWYIDLSAGPYSGGSDCLLLVELVPINLGS